MTNDIQVLNEATPNPQSMKFVVSQQICEENIQFEEATLAARSPLAQKIFGFPWALVVFIGPDFVTITKRDWVEWEVLADPLCQLIKEHIERGEHVLLDPNVDTDSDSPNTIQPDDSPIVQQIKEILNRDIRPAVAMDGGDIAFHKYEDRILYIHMQGACAGCPSSTMTLKMGIETRMKELIPEIQEVVSV